MMLDWLFASTSERRLLPGGRFSGPTPWVIAIMTFSMLIVAAAGLALSNAAGVVREGVEDRYVVQVPNGSAALPKVLQTLRSADVTGAKAVPEAELRRTLEQWLGPAGGAADLPVPALIHFDLNPGTDIEALAKAVARVAPGARISEHRQSVAPLLASMRALQWLAITLVMLMALATSATVVLAARGALDTHRSTIDVMHGIGATDLQVTHLFQRKIALDAVVGSLLGAAAAGIALLLLAGSAALSQDLVGKAPIGVTDVIIIVLLLPILIVVSATWVARVAVLAALRRSI
ncbi:MAG: cell division protein [Sphingomicrobium sp.]